MTVKHDSLYVRLASSGTGYPATKGVSLSAHHMRSAARNINYMLATRSAPVLMSGCGHYVDLGSYAGISSYASSWSGSARGPRGRNIIMYPYNSIGITYSATKVVGQTGTIMWYVSDRPGAVISESDIEGDYLAETTAITADSSYEYVSISLDNIPIPLNRMIYIYSVLTNIFRMGCWTVYAKQVTG